MIQKKVCMLGAFAVGKTSLVSRFVRGIFSERYLTTIGVKIDSKTVVVNGTHAQLLLWDIHGDDEFQRVRRSYLRGAAGYLLVLDGTRPETLAKTRALHELAREELGDVPFQTLINKADLKEQWQLDDRLMHDLIQQGWSFRETSAKSGIGVDLAFQTLASQLLSQP